MNLFQRIASIFSAQRPPGTGDDRYLTIYLYSNRCREPIYARIDRLNELSIAEPPDPDSEDSVGIPTDAAWFVRKVVHTTGEKRCFGEVEVELWLDGRKQVLHYEVKGGRWLEEYEYDALIDEAIARAAEEEAAAAASDAATGP